MKIHSTLAIHMHTHVLRLYLVMQFLGEDIFTMDQNKEDTGQNKEDTDQSKEDTDLPETKDSSSNYQDFDIRWFSWSKPD